MSKRVEDLTDKELEYWLREIKHREYLEEKRRELERRRVFARIKIREAFGDTVPDQEINHHKEH